MSFKVFVQPAETDMNIASDPERMIRSDPSQAEKFAAIATLRELDDGDFSGGFKRVASLQAPLMNLMHCFDPEFMKSKRSFYKWLDSGNNRAYCTYDRRSARVRQAQFDRDFGHLGKGLPDGIPVLQQAHAPEAESGSLGRP